jgi:hypothetical protein
MTVGKEDRAPSASMSVCHPNTSEVANASPVADEVAPASAVYESPIHKATGAVGV